MTAVTIYDTLILEPLARGEIQLSCRWAHGLAARHASTNEPSPGDRHDLPHGKDNLVWRAVELLMLRSEADAGARISLIKRIPAAAGLGGASSDAAAALLAANEAWNLGWSMERLAELAAELGSDVPFFFACGKHGPGTAICRGRGERIEPVAGFPRQNLVVTRPADGLSTADVYRSYRDDSAKVPIQSMLDAASARNIPQTASSMTNRLQAAARQLSRSIDELAKRFGESGCHGHQMSGSGSSYFGICRSARHARRVAARLRGESAGTVAAAASAPHQRTPHE